MLKPAERTGIGLSFVGLSFISPAAVMSMSNSSRFSYRSFIRDEATEQAAREALSTFRWQSWATSAVLGVMGGAATKNIWWGAAAFGIGVITTELLLLDMIQVVNEVVARNRVKGAPPPPTDQTRRALVGENPVLTIVI